MMNMISDKCPTCGHRKPRSNSQNRRYFELLTKASEKLGYSKDIWHEYMKQKFLPSQIIDVLGEEKLIPFSTANLPMHPDPQNPDVPNWDSYTMDVEVFLAENGVYLEM